MADIFISYSRKDSEQALSLCEQLRRDPVLAPLRGTPEFEELIQELEGVSNHSGGTDNSLHSKH